jgi:RNA polymerase sigma factor (sigma-70 family)
MADDESSRRTPPPPFEERLVAAAAREDMWPRDVVQDRELLKDFVHDAVKAVLEWVRDHPDAFQGPGQLEAFFRQTLRRIALNHVKARETQAKAMERAFVQFDAQRRAAHGNMNPSGALLAGELALEITKVLKGMRPRVRQAWRLHARGDLSTDEAAALMGVGIATYLRHVVTANRILRDALRYHLHGGLDRNESVPPATPTPTTWSDELGTATDQETLQ